MDILIIVLLLIFAIILLILEIFVLPGFGIAGIAGILFSVGGIYYAFRDFGTTGGVVTIVSMLVAFAVTIAVSLKSGTWQRISLKADINGINDPLKDTDIKPGDVGMTIGRLAPMGKVTINGSIVEAKSIGGYINQKTPVEVVKILNTNIVVKPINS